MLAEVARQALRVMHFDIAATEGYPETQAALSDVEDARCVAACYRCLMSYFNQPDHELLDRRDPKARELLLRLVRSLTTLAAREVALTTSYDRGGGQSTSMVAALAIWRDASSARGLPHPDSSPLIADGVAVPLVWRDHYVAAWLGSPNQAAAGHLADLGFELVAFEGPEDTWAAPFAKLSKALGRT